MREILFRGKRKDNGNFIEGFFIFDGFDHYIVKFYADENAEGTLYPVQESFEVIPGTVGQFTGLTDKNGKKIFEGDICRVCLDPEICVGKVIWDDKIASYNFLFGDGKCVLPLDLWLNKDNPVWVEVIGNIHDNPELLEGE